MLINGARQKVPPQNTLHVNQSTILLLYYSTTDKVSRKAKCHSHIVVSSSNLDDCVVAVVEVEVEEQSIYIYLPPPQYNHYHHSTTANDKSSKP